MAIPLTTHRVPPSDIVLATLRLLWIEVRRGAGMVAVPLFLAAIWFAVNIHTSSEGTSDLLWPAASLHVGFTSILLAPVVAGLLAWEGGREGRRKMGDLLVTMPGHAIRRDLARWAGTTGWAVLTYVAYGAYTLLPVARSATWGGPRWDALALGITTVLAAGAVGYAAGVAVPSRFVPPVVAVISYGVIVGVGALQQDDTLFDLKYLTPYSAFGYWSPDVGLYQRIEPDLFVPMVAWTLALGTVALAGVALRRGVTTATQAAMIASVAFAGVAALPLVPAQQHENGWIRPRSVAYEPVCQTTTVEVCVHPALEPLLPGYAAAIGDLVKPIAGVPGGVVRAVPYAMGRSGLMADGTFWFYIPISKNPPDPFAISMLAQQLVTDFEETNGRWESCPGLMTNAQYVTMAALTGRVTPPLSEPNASMPDLQSYILTCEMVGDIPMGQGMGSAIDERGDTPEAAEMRAEIIAAIGRFEALTLDQQRAWFAANLTALRAGELTLEHLP